MSLVEALLWIVAAGWAFLMLRCAWDLRFVRDLPPLPEPPPRNLPRVTIVVPARDEAERIGPAVERFLAQSGVELEVVVVDDRSRDDTAAIVRALAARDARVRLEQVAGLPPGWLGKPHACQRGGEVARGTWILFTDGDVFLAPDVLARALAAARSDQADHVTIGARLDQASLGAQAAVCSFGVMLLHELAAANRDEPASGVGIGAFNLVRADAWRAIGGHAALAFEVVDDLRLGRLLRRGGFRTRAYLGRGALSVVWARSPWDVVRALEKNFFAELGYSALQAAATSSLLLALWLGAMAGPFTLTTAGWAAFLAYVLPIAPAALASSRLGIPWRAALLLPLYGWVLPFAIANSTARTLVQGGVRWRGTFYPLAELRARRVR